MKVSNNFRMNPGKRRPANISYADELARRNIVSKKVKIIAWGIFLFFFIESGTLGILPKQFYFVYRNMRISDFLLYALTLYSFFNIKEFPELFRSRAVIIPKLILVYFGLQFIVSAILYEYNIVEFFFRLKGIWKSFLIFPFMLLLKRKGLGYLIKLMLPVAIVSNILYILSALTGIAFMPDIGISEQNLPGGLKVFRVYGGTFFGELFFLGFIYYWITKKFRLYQLFLVILFIIPHILAFGRGAWIYYILTIIIMISWYIIRKREFRLALRQIIIFSIFGIVLIYSFIRFVPQSDYLIEAIGARVIQGQDDFKYEEGTFGTRLANINALLLLWQNSNIFFGIGMHPFWVIEPVTVEESIYAWGFSDVGWASVLTAYGLVGFVLAILFQVYYLINSLKLVRRSPYADLPVFFILVFMSRLFSDSVINYSYKGLTVGLLGFGAVAFFVSILVYKYEHPDEEYTT